MRKCIVGMLLASSALAWPFAVLGATDGFSFGLIAQAPGTASTEATLQHAITESDSDNLAFVVASGIKTSREPCTDALYNSRRNLLDGAQNGLIVSLTASDWVGCKRQDGKSAAIDRLTRLRELFFVGSFSLGATKIPLIRQSITPKFRIYGENARWEVGEVLFATVNLPSDNNHYLADAGRNSEFEDRLIANRDWLHKVFILAARKNVKYIVLFSDGNPLDKPSSGALAKLSGHRDGFRETRQLITSLARKFPGKVLLVHSKRAAQKLPAESIVWRANIGQLAASPGWTKVTLDKAGKVLTTRYTGASTQDDSQREHSN